MQSYMRIEQWFHAHGSDVHHFLVYYVGHANVEDLVQEVFLKALRGIDRYEGRANPRTWLFSIARHVAIDHERKESARRQLFSRLAKDAPEPNRTELDEIFLQQEELRTAYRLIRKLKRSYRDVLLLRILQEFTVEETAELLKWSKVRVNVTLHRSLRKLRDLYAKQEGGFDLASDEG